MAEPKNIDRKNTLPTQNFVNLRGVKEGVLVLANGALRQILMVGGVNFDLKSEEERDAIIYSYQNFLNSLDFSIQIFTHSRKINIDKYIEGLNQRELKESNPLLRSQITEYREFIRAFVSENAIMQKSFFVVVPYDPVQLPEAGKKATKKIFTFLSKEKTSPIIKGEEELHIDQYLNQISQRTDQVVSGLNQVGLRAVPLNDDESIELFYNLYNPETTEKKGMTIANPSEQL